MIQVQQRSLRAFEEHSLSSVHLGIQIGRGVRKQRHNLRGEFQALVG